MEQVLAGGGMVVGPYHGGGGVHLPFQDTGRYIEEEGMEINIPRELYESKAIHSFSGTNASVLNEILKLAGLSISDQVTTVKFGDIVICVRSAWDDTIRKHVGTIEEILHTINTSKGCKPIMVNGKGIMDNGNTKSDTSPISHLPSPIKKNGGKLPNGIIPRKKDLEAINPNSDRWKKKKQRIEELSNNIHKLRLNVSRDVQDDDERTALTALVVALMDRTAERIGNDDSADNGHFGVTGFRKKHISVVGSKVHLDYVGKSGTKHEKSFSDVRIAKALKKAIRNAPGKFIFETSDGFRIKSDKVNRYLEPFNISAKDLRGYNANKWIIDKLLSQKSKVISEQPEKARKERKKIFNKAVKEVAMRVGHGSGTLKKHYMIPELPVQYIEYGRIIDMKNLGYYREGGKIEKVLWAVKKGDPDYAEQMLTNKEERFEDAKKWASENGFDRFRIATVDLSEKPDFTKTFNEGGPIPSVEEKITQRLQERQKTKEFKDTGIATYTRKYRAAYDIITLSDLVDIEKDNVTAYKLIEKSKIWPPYIVNELKELGNSSGAAYLKVKCREFLSARPLDTREAREVYVKAVEKLRAGLQPLTTVQDVKKYLEEFADLDKFDLGDISSFKQSYYGESSYTGNLAKYNRTQVEEYFNNIFGKKFYNFCKVQSDPAKKIVAEAVLYSAYTKEQREKEVDKTYAMLQVRNKILTTLLEKIQAASDDESELRKILVGSNYYGTIKKQAIIEWINLRLPFTQKTKEQVDQELSKIYTVRPDDWSWSTAEKKEVLAKDEEGKPRAPQNIFEKYGVEVPKVIKRTPLDFIKRKGGLEVGDISTKAILENFGFKNIIYGNYVNDAESKEHTRHILGAMLDMVELLNISIKDINKLGGLDINIGATGCGSFSTASACYFPSLKAINLTKKRGDGSVGHEWGHYLDNVLAEGTDKKATNIQWATDVKVQLKSSRVQMLLSEYRNWLMIGGTPRKIKVTFYPQKKFMYRIYADNVPAAVKAVQERYASYKDYKNANTNDVSRYYGYMAYKINNNQPLEIEMETKATNFWVNSSMYHPYDYYTDPQELFARSFEAWLEYKLVKMDRQNNYLVNIVSGMGMLAAFIPRNEWPYPFGEELIWLNDWFERLFSAIRVDYGIAPFTWGTAERVDEYTDYKDKAKTEKIDAGVTVATDGEVTVTGGDIEEFEKGYGFRIGSMKDAKGEPRNIYRLITDPYSRGKGLAVGGVQSDVFIFANKYFTNKKTGYGIADGVLSPSGGGEGGGLPNIMKVSGETVTLSDAKKEAIDYYKTKTGKYSEGSKITNENSSTMKNSKIRSSILEIINSDTLKKDELIYEAMDALIGLKGTLMLFAGKTGKSDVPLAKTNPEQVIEISIEQLDIIEKVYEKYLQYQNTSGIEKLHEGGSIDPDRDNGNWIIVDANNNLLLEESFATEDEAIQALDDMKVGAIARNQPDKYNHAIVKEKESVTEQQESLPLTISSDEQEPKKCGCFFVFIRKENPELVEQIAETDINSNSELRQKFDEEYKKWNGGKI